MRQSVLVALKSVVAEVQRTRFGFKTRHDNLVLAGERAENGRHSIEWHKCSHDEDFSEKSHRFHAPNASKRKEGVLKTTSLNRSRHSCQPPEHTQRETVRQCAISVRCISSDLTRVMSLSMGTLTGVWHPPTENVLDSGNPARSAQAAKETIHVERQEGRLYPWVDLYLRVMFGWDWIGTTQEDAQGREVALARCT